MMASEINGKMQGSAALMCADVQALLSDWLDVRRGEIPPAGISPLSEERYRSSYDAHLGTCQHCKCQLQDLEMLGSAFSEFSVNELPDSHFQSYASKVKARIQAETPATSNVIQVPQERWTRREATPRWAPWVVMVASSSAAAMLAVVLTLGVFGKSGSTKSNRTEVAVEKNQTAKVVPVSMVAQVKPKTPKSVANQKFVSAPSFLVTANGMVQPVSNATNTRKVNVADMIQQLDSELSKQGALVFWETPVEINKERKCLLGMALLARSPNQQAAPENTPEGLKIVDLLDKSPAFMKAGLLPNDVIISLNDMSFERSSPTEILKFYNAIEALGAGETVTMEFARKENNFWVIRQTVVQLGDYTE